MKRKVIEMAGKTLLVSIPKEITKKFEISKGDEIDLSYSEDLIYIQKDFSRKRKLVLPFSQELIILKAIKIAYQQGYDEVIFKSNPDSFQRLHSFVYEELPGFEIIKLNEKMTLVKSILDISDDDIKKLFRKITLSINHVYDYGVDFNKLKSTIIRLCNISKRMIIKKSLPKNYLQIACVFEYWAQDLLNIKRFSEITNHFKECTNTFFSFDILKFYDLYLQNEKFLENKKYNDFFGTLENLKTYLELVFSIYLKENEE